MRSNFCIECGKSIAQYAKRCRDCYKETFREMVDNNTSKLKGKTISKRGYHLVKIRHDSPYLPLEAVISIQDKEIKLLKWRIKELESSKEKV